MDTDLFQIPMALFIDLYIFIYIYILYIYTYVTTCTQLLDYHLLFSLSSNDMTLKTKAFHMIISYKRVKKSTWACAPVVHTRARTHTHQCTGNRGSVCRKDRKIKKKKKAGKEEDEDERDRDRVRERERERDEPLESNWSLLHRLKQTGGGWWDGQDESERGRRWHTHTHWGNTLSPTQHTHTHGKHRKFCFVSHTHTQITAEAQSLTDRTQDAEVTTFNNAVMLTLSDGFSSIKTT